MQSNFDISPSSSYDNLDKAMNEVWKSANGSKMFSSTPSKSEFNPNSLAVKGVIAATLLSPSLSWIHYDISSYAFSDYHQSLNNIRHPLPLQIDNMPGLAFEPFAPKKLTRATALVSNISSYKPIFEG